MMFVSPHLKFDPTNSLSPELEALCNMRAEIPAEVNLHAFAAGQFWVYPLGRNADTTLVGLQLSPGKALADSAVVEFDGAISATLASSPAYLVPIRLHDRMLTGGRDWDQIAKLPAKTWKALVTLHETLGGEDELEHIRKLTSDKAVKAAYEKGRADFRGLVTAWFESQQRLDRAPETSVYARYMIKAVLDRLAPVPTPEAGCWNGALASMALFVSQNDPDDEPHREEELWASWRTSHCLPGLDTGRSGKGSSASLDLETSANINHGAAKVVTKRKLPAWEADPLLPAIEKLAKSKKYDGSAHHAAAAALEKAKDYSGAFIALASCSYWQVVANGTAKRDTLDQARKLAHKAKWTEVADSLDEMFDTRKEVEAEES
jgi:hypothetical protein